MQVEVEVGWRGVNVESDAGEVDSPFGTGSAVIVVVVVVVVVAVRCFFFGYSLRPDPFIQATRKLSSVVSCA